MSNRASAKDTKRASAVGSWARAKKRSARNQAGTNAKATAAMEKLLAQRRWPEARLLIQEEMVFAPMDHWLWMMLGLTYYEQRDYDKALACGKRAVELMPSCHLALWNYAGALYMTGQEDGALAIWMLLLSTDLEEVAYGDCGEGMDWALRLVNDVQYRVGRYHQWKGDHERARASFRKYLHNREHGVASTYDAEPIRKYLAEGSS